ncbi:MAG TPA: hypothetical protein VF038_03660 [Usitatibacter sp.]
MSRDYPTLPAPTSCDDDPAHEPLDAKTMRERLAERDAKRGRG